MEITYVNQKEITFFRSRLQELSVALQVNHDHLEKLFFFLKIGLSCVNFSFNISHDKIALNLMNY